MASERLPRRLHAQHFAYLRAFVEGIDSAHAARLYLGIDDGRRARTLHRTMLGDLRALAKRLGDARWRLLGVSLPPKAMARPEPYLDEWTSAKGLDDWSQAERLEMYQEAFPTDGPNRKGRRNERVRRRQLELLKILEPMASQAVQPDHPVDAWLPEDGPKLAAVGLQTMGQLAEAIASGRKWWRAIPSFGPTKAQRIVDQLQFLYPNAMTSIRQGGLVEIRHAFLADPNRRDLDGSRGANRAPEQPRIDAVNDREAIGSWLRARAGRSAFTARSYLREAERFLLWCVIERHKPLSAANVDDCVAYLGFIQAIPVRWISKAKADRHSHLWAPFRGQLTPVSRKHAVRLLYNLFEWLAQQRYLASNPWSAIDRSAAEGDEPADETTSRALSVEAYETLLTHAVQAGLAGAAPRNRFLVEFLRHTGLRASELVAARVADLRHDEWGYSLAVVGKGRQRRTVTLSRPAVTACETYFETRGLRFPEADQPTLPLVAATTDPLGCVSYPSLYASFRAFVRSAFADMPDAGPAIGPMREATLHWLRHTFATRSAEAEMPEDVLMAELGHRSRETTARYYTSQARRRRAEMERAAASDRTGSRNGEPNDA